MLHAGHDTNGDSHNFSASPIGDAITSKHVYKKFGPRKRPWYQAGENTQKATWSPIYRHFVIKDLALTVSLPVYDTQHRLLGVLGVDYVLTRFHQFLRSIEVGEHGVVFIMERSGNLIAASSMELGRSSQEQNGKYVRIKAANASSKPVAAAARFLESRYDDLNALHGETMFRFEIDGGSQFLQVASFHKKHGLDWLVVVAVPEADLKMIVIYIKSYVH